MRSAVLAWLVGCGFHGPSLGPDAASGSADVPSSSCTIGAGPVMPAVGTVGESTGGANFKTLECDAADQVIGVALDFSNQNISGYMSPSSRGAVIACASVTVATAGTTVGAVTMKQIDGDGGVGFGPSTVTPFAMCPTGGVVIGLSAHSTFNRAFLVNAAITCEVLSPSGGVVQVEAIGIPNTTSNTEEPTSAQCPEGTHVAQLIGHTGAGLDALEVVCAPTICS